MCEICLGQACHRPPSSRPSPTTTPGTNPSNTKCPITPKHPVHKTRPGHERHHSLVQQRSKQQRSTQQAATQHAASSNTARSNAASLASTSPMPPGMVGSILGPTNEHSSSIHGLTTHKSHAIRMTELSAAPPRTLQSQRPHFKPLEHGLGNCTRHSRGTTTYGTAKGFKGTMHNPQ